MKFFLFQPELSEEATRSQRRWYILWRVFWVTAAGIGAGLVSLLLGQGEYPLRLWLNYLGDPRLFLLNVAPAVFLVWFFTGLTRRPGAGFLLGGGIMVGFSLANYYKLAFRDDPIMFADLFTLREAGNMAGKYHLFLNGRIVFALFCVAAGWLFLRFFAPFRLSRRGRSRWAALLMSAALSFFTVIVSLNDSLYNATAHYEYLANQWSSTGQYIAHGFAYPFLHSVSTAFETAPEGYDPDTAQTMLDAYQDADIPEDKQVNVVGIMLEAFQDFSRFGVPELSRDIYADYHAWEEESYTGDLVTNIFAGGTVDTERCFLTGYSTLSEFRANTNAYPWYFRSQGYQVTGMHPCFQWFYNRENVNSYLGFEDYKFVENYFGEFTGGGVATDYIFIQSLIEDLKTRQEGAPIFSFSVSYQGHGPYGSDPMWWSDLADFFPADAPYTQEQMGTMANYFGSVENTIGNLMLLKDFLAEQEEPYVLVIFGDHNPWMGDGNSIYQAMGLNLDQSTQEGFSNYYSTRYLIWANDAAKKTLGNDFQGEGPAIGPYFLMNKLFELCGWDGPAYLQATNAVSAQVPVQHTTGVYLENGLFTTELTPEGEALSQDYDWIQYYYRHDFHYDSLSK